MTEQEQQIQNELVNEIPLVQWWGDAVEAMPAATALLSADQQIFTRVEDNEALFFYDGDQWPIEIKTRRENESRPCLVMNRLPLLVAAAIAADPGCGLELKPGRCYSQVQADAFMRLKIIVTRRNMDAQRAYNYMCSAVAEMVSTGKVWGK